MPRLTIPRGDTSRGPLDGPTASLAANPPPVAVLSPGRAVQRLLEVP